MTPAPNDFSRGGGVRINLLPPEIVEKRKAESRRLIFVAIGLTLVALLGVAWAFLALFVGIKTGDVVSAQQQAATLRAQAAAFKVFEDRGRDLAARKAVAERALSNRVDWALLMGDLSLVLPPDVWLEAFAGVQPARSTAGSAGTSATLALTGWSLNQPTDKANGGFKSIAQLLVRLNDLDELTNVWLTSAEISPEGYRTKDAIKFVSTSDIVVAPSAATATTTTTVPGKP